jgi:hypothetical protein
MKSFAAVAIVAVAFLALASAGKPIVPKAATVGMKHGAPVARPANGAAWAHNYVTSAKGEMSIVPNPKLEATWRFHVENKVRTQPTATFHVLKSTETGAIQTAAGFHVQDEGDDQGHGQGDQGHGDQGHNDDDDDHDHRLAEEYEALLANNTRIVNSLKALYATAIYNNCGQYLDALKANNLTLLDQLIAPVVAQGAQGRIHPLGYFDSSEGLVEYFMLACFPGPNVTQVVKETWTEITAYNNIVHFNIDFCFQVPPYNPALPCNNLTHVGWARADNNGKIKAIKILFQRLGINDLVIPPLSNPTQQYIVTATQTGTAEFLCSAVQARCTGSNLQYNTTADCMAYYSSINYGNLERADQRDLGCVSIHSTLTQSRPQIHCPHVGPNGGNPAVEFPCINHGSDWFYQTDDILYNL